MVGDGGIWPAMTSCVQRITDVLLSAPRLYVIQIQDREKATCYNTYVIVIVAMSIALMYSCFLFLFYSRKEEDH